MAIDHHSYHNIGGPDTRFFVQDLEFWLDLLIYDLISLIPVCSPYHVIVNIWEDLIYDSVVLAAIYVIWNRVIPLAQYRYLASYIFSDISFQCCPLLCNI